MSNAFMYGSKAGQRAADIFRYTMLVIISALMILPIIYMLSTSVKTSQELYAFPPTIVPKTFALSNYIKIFSDIPFLTFYKNSIIIAAGATFGTLLSSSLVAYGFARYRARGRNVMFMIIICTLLLPYPALIIPQFLVFKSIGWVDTFFPLIIPAFFGSAYNIFLLRQFFLTLPNDLFEAARVDGSSEIRTWWSIALPLCKSALATVGIFMFIWCWNNVIDPVVYLNTVSKYTIPVGLNSLYSPTKAKVPWNTIMVGNVFALLPIVFIFFRAQKYFIEGITITGLK